MFCTKKAPHCARKACNSTRCMAFLSSGHIALVVAYLVGEVRRRPRVVPALAEFQVCGLANAYFAREKSK